MASGAVLSVTCLPSARLTSPQPSLLQGRVPTTGAPLPHWSTASLQKLGEAAGGGQTREPGFLCASDGEQGRLPLLGMLGSGGGGVSAALCRGGRGRRSQPQSLSWTAPGQWPSEQKGSWASGGNENRRKRAVTVVGRYRSKPVCA